MSNESMSKETVAFSPDAEGAWHLLMSTLRPDQRSGGMAQIRVKTELRMQRSQGHAAFLLLTKSRLMMYNRYIEKIVSFMAQK
jgi:hypothetical protein